MALKRVMAKALGQRMLSQQETTHLTLSLPMVSCSHLFARMNLDDNKCLINMQNTANENYNVVAGNTNHGNNTSGNNTVGGTAVANNEISNVMDGNATHGNNMPGINAPQNNSSIIAATGTTKTMKCIVEMHCLRMDKKHWLNDDS